MEKEFSSEVEVQFFEDLMRQPSYELMVLAGRWFEKEIKFAQSSAAKIPIDEKIKFVKTMASWALGNYVYKWFDPLTHSTIVQEVISNPETELWVFGRLPLLAASDKRLNPELRSESPCLLHFRNMAISPEISNEKFDSEGIGFPKPLMEGLKPNWGYLIPMFGSNHWLLLLLFCIASYKFLGFDQKLIEANVA